MLVFGAFGVAVVADLSLAVHFGGSLGYGLITSVGGGGSVVVAMVARRAIGATTEVPGLVFGSLAAGARWRGFPRMHEQKPAMSAPAS